MYRLLIIGIFLSILFSCQRQKTTDSDFTSITKMEKIKKNMPFWGWIVYIKHGEKWLLRKYCQYQESGEYIFKTSDQEHIFNVVFYLSRHGYKYYFGDLSGVHFLLKDN